ncbi:hypothetical protein DFQ28_011011 [Apophysomyces sp. BC1034]|nr:hypothetical protein DFQ30_010833 [Apophysomyces sp. BC1015]KAG0184523.1 hypothetical protein DFQ28_011011 [Apophysomyces sp. BC1034]
MDQHAQPYKEINRLQTELNAAKSRATELEELDAALRNQLHDQTSQLSQNDFSDFAHTQASHQIDAKPSNKPDNPWNYTERPAQSRSI